MEYYLICINVISMFLYGIDKFLAISKLRRISENTLLFISVIGGSVGSLLSMIVFRHKIRKSKFVIINVLFSLIYLYIYLFKLKNVL